MESASVPVPGTAAPAAIERRRPLIVGIAGGTASGKTTICGRLVERLAGYIVLDMHMDRYFLRVKPRMRAPISGLDYEDHNHPSSSTWTPSCATWTPIARPPRPTSSSSRAC